MRRGISRVAAFVAFTAVGGSAPRSAGAQLVTAGSWLVSVRGEQTRLGSYFDRETTGQFGTRLHTWLRTAPHNGAVASLTRFRRESDWGVAADIGYGGGDFIGGIRSESASGSQESGRWGRSAIWTFGASVVRRFGGGDRVSALLGAGPTLTRLSMQLPIGDLVLVPPSLGSPGYTDRAMVATSYASAGAGVGGSANVVIRGGLSLQLSATGAMQRANGDAITRDLESTYWPFGGAGPEGAGGAQWRPWYRFGIGLGYARGTR